MVRGVIRTATFRDFDLSASGPELQSPLPNVASWTYDIFHELRQSRCRSCVRQLSALCVERQFRPFADGRPDCVTLCGISRPAVRADRSEPVRERQQRGRTRRLVCSRQGLRRCHSRPGGTFPQPKGWRIAVSCSFSAIEYQPAANMPPAAAELMDIGSSPLAWARISAILA